MGQVQPGVGEIGPGSEIHPPGRGFQRRIGATAIGRRGRVGGQVGAVGNGGLESNCIGIADGHVAQIQTGQPYIGQGGTVQLTAARHIRHIAGKRVGQVDILGDKAPVALDGDPPFDDVARVRGHLPAYKGTGGIFGDIPRFLGQPNIGIGRLNRQEPRRRGGSGTRNGFAGAAEPGRRLGLPVAREQGGRGAATARRIDRGIQCDRDFGPHRQHAKAVVLRKHIGEIENDPLPIAVYLRRHRWRSRQGDVRRGMGKTPRVHHPRRQKLHKLSVKDIHPSVVPGRQREGGFISAVIHGPAGVGGHGHFRAAQGDHAVLEQGLFALRVAVAPDKIRIYR